MTKPIFREFQTRVARGVAEGRLEEMDAETEESSEPQRAALGELKAKKKAPTNRAAALKQGQLKYCIFIKPLFLFSFIHYCLHVLYSRKKESLKHIFKSQLGLFHLKS